MRKVVFSQSDGVWLLSVTFLEAHNGTGYSLESPICLTLELPAEMVDTFREASFPCVETVRDIVQMLAEKIGAGGVAIEFTSESWHHGLFAETNIEGTLPQVLHNR